MTIAFVQKGANSQVGGAGGRFNTPTITGVTAGNWLVALGWGATDTTAALTPPSGWTLAANGTGQLYASPSAVNSAIFFKQSSGGGSESCQFDWTTTGTYSECHIFEVSAPGGLVLGPTARGGATSGTSGTAGPTSATSAQTLVAAVANMLNAAFSATNINTATSGFTTLYNDFTGAVYIPGDSAYKIVSAGTQQASWTWTNSASWVGTLATFTEGSSGTNLTPGVGALALSGYAPTVARTANQSVAPGVGALTLAGYAPTVARTANQAVAPSVGALTLTGYAPSVTQGAGLTLTPGVAALALAGYAPSVTQSANQSVAPGVSALVLAGYAPTVTRTANQGVAPGVAALVLTGFAPVVTQASASISLAPDAGVLTLTGYAPTVQQSGNDPFPLGSGGAPLEYFPRQPSANERKRLKRAAAWAEEERRITAALNRKPVRWAEEPEPEEPVSNRAEIIEAVAEAVRARSQEVAREEVQALRAEKEAEIRGVAQAAQEEAKAVQRAEAEAEIAQAVAVERARLIVEAVEAEMQMVHAAAKAQDDARRRRNEAQAIAHALLLLVDT